VNTTDIGLLGMASSGVLILLAVLISLWRGLGLERSLLWAASRALVQLLAVGAALQLVIDEDDPLAYSVAWLVVMVLVAAHTTGRRSGDVGSVFGLALAAYAASAMVTLGVLFGFGIYELNGRTLVPLAGIVIGNSLSATVLVTRRLLDAAHASRHEIEGRLALGATSAEAFAPLLNSSVRTALIPQIESTKAVGIIALPGAMVGLILAGVDAGDAVRIQLSVMYLVLGSVATTTTVMGIGLSRRLFNSSHQLLYRATPD